MLGQGVYTLAEVTQYTGVPDSTLRSWFLPRPDKRGFGPVFASDYAAEGKDFAVSFLNLIEAHVASFFKKQGVTPALIRRAHEVLQEQLGTSHPFAHEDLRTDSHRIFHIIRSDAKLVDVVSRQMLFKNVKPYLRGIKYALATRLAETWHVRKGIVINPKLGFGKPVIENSGVSTLIVAKQYVANGKNATLVARLFKITEEGVQNAFRYEKRLGRIAA
jgi:uncharacterized protein (DUF433 family)